MKDTKTLLRTTAGAILLGLAACGTERDAVPVSDAPPAREEAAPLEPDPRIRPAPDGLTPADTLTPGDAERLYRGPDERGPADLHPRLERRGPSDLEADLRRRSSRAPLWVA
jgi:hypothetical protein